MVPPAIGPAPVLCLVTDRGLVPPGTLAERVRLAVAGGVTMVQLREKDLDTPSLAALGREVRAVTHGRALLLVNGDPEAAALVGADGVHLPQDGPPVAQVRNRLGRDSLVGRSVHSVEAATRAQSEGADYLIAGTIFQTQSKPGKEPDGLAYLRRLASAVKVPVLGIGGINAENAGSVLGTGAYGVAVISAVLGEADPEPAARRLIAGMAEENPAWEGPGITLTVNGKRQSLAGPTRLTEFLSTRVDPKRMVAIGYNGEVIHRQDWDKVLLGEGDMVDIVHMVGGG